MRLHAIEVTEESSPMITRLNDGIHTKRYDEPTYFVFDADELVDLEETFISEQELLSRYDSIGRISVLRIE